MAYKPYNSFAIAQAQFDGAAELLGLDQATRDLLRSPMREYAFAIPVRLDDGTTKVFRGFRVQHKQILPQTLDPLIGGRSLTHGEAAVAEGLAGHIREVLSWDASAPTYLETVQLG
jgi:hypothetical protein